AGDYQKAQEQPEDDRKVQKRIEYYYQRQTDSWEAELLQQVGMFQKDSLAAAQYLGKQAPGEQACTQVDAVAQIVIHTRQACLHQPGEDHGVNDDHRQRIDDGPQGAEQGVTVA